MKRTNFFLTHKYSHPERNHLNSLLSDWREDYLDETGRIVDIGPDNGLTALDIYSLQRKRELTNKSYLLITIVLAFLLIVVFLLWFFWTVSISSAIAVINQYGTILSSIAMMFLTLGLLIATWRYMKLTALIVSEMKESRRFEVEPQISVVIFPWLTKNDDPTIAFKYFTRVIVRNNGKTLALNASMNYSSYTLNETGNLVVGGGTLGLDDSDTGVIQPESEVCVRLGFFKEKIENYSEDKLSNFPFLILRLRFRDSYNQVYSVTQDYTLDKISDSDTALLRLQCEFISSPLTYRWRGKFDGRGIWISA